MQDWVFRLGFWWCCSKLLCSSALSVYCSWWPLTAYNGHSERIFGAISYQDFSTRFGNVSLYHVINIVILCTKWTVIFFLTINWKEGFVDIWVWIIYNRSLWWLGGIAIIRRRTTLSSLKTRQAPNTPISNQSIVTALRGWFCDPTKQKAFQIHFHLLHTQVGVQMKIS